MIVDNTIRDGSYVINYIMMKSFFNDAGVSKKIQHQQSEIQAVKSAAKSKFNTNYFFKGEMFDEKF